MTFDILGNRAEDSEFNFFVDFIKQLPHNGWEYAGMNVELDPTVDYSAKNIKFRWLDLDEGFNDKILLSTKEEFLNTFLKIA